MPSSARVHFLIDRYVKWGLPAEKFSMLENGIDTAHVAPLRSLPANGRRARFGFFGQVTEFKGMQVLLDAVTRVPDSVWGEDAALCIFGGNLENQPVAFRENFEALVEKAGRRAKFYGAYRSEEMPDLMRQVDWVVVPSIWWENSPLVIQESFLHGRPVIASDIGGMKEKVLDGINGIHFRMGSAEDLADKLSRVLSEPDIWAQLRDCMPHPLSHEEAAQQHLDLYSKLAIPSAAPAKRHAMVADFRRRNVMSASAEKNEAAAVRQVSVNGYIDAITGNRIYGWAWDAQQPAAKITLRMQVNGKMVGVIIADLPREDLKASGIGDGAHAFDAAIPEGVSPNDLKLMAVCPDTGQTVELAPRAIAGQAESERRFRSAQRGRDLDQVTWLHSSQADGHCGGAGGNRAVKGRRGLQAMRWSSQARRTMPLCRACKRWRTPSFAWMTS